MMSGKQMKAALDSSARKLLKELKPEPGLTFPALKISETTTGGFHARLASWRSMRVHLELWLDRAAGGDVPRYWYGFSSRSQSPIRRLLGALPSALGTNRAPLEERDFEWDEAEGFYKYSNPNKAAQSAPYWEHYPGSAFFGVYDWGGHGTQAKKEPWLWPAVQFFSDRLSALANLTDSEVEGWEGEKRIRFVMHRKREAALRQAKLKAVASAANGQLACEVHNCGFVFQQKYGRLGEGFAEVHHKLPLSTLIGETKVKLKDLAVVCSNCHRMIHRAMSQGDGPWPEKIVKWPRSQSSHKS